MKFQRRQNRVYLVFVHIFMVPCNFQLFSFLNNLIKPGPGFNDFKVFFNVSKVSFLIIQQKIWQQEFIRIRLPQLQYCSQAHTNTSPTKSKVLLNKLSFLSQYVRKITKGLMKILQINYNIQKLLISFIYFILAEEKNF